MKRNTLNFWVDFLGLLGMVGLVFTGLLMRYVLPPGIRGGAGLTLGGMNRHDIGDIHLWLAVTVLVVVVVHIWLHWTWVCATVTELAGRAPTTRSQRLRRLGYGSGLFIVVAGLIAGALLWASSSVQRGGGERHGRGAQAVGGAGLGYQGGYNRGTVGQEANDDEDSAPSPHITGRTTLAEAARTGKIPVEKLIAGLKLPADVNVNETLGRLKRQYGFEIGDVRAIVNRGAEEDQGK
jgi:hypothetical protein